MIGPYPAQEVAQTKIVSYFGDVQLRRFKIHPKSCYHRRPQIYKSFRNKKKVEEKNDTDFFAQRILKHFKAGIAAQ